jgi:uncharacterized SAM-binding protein YcdF (DUF218 family)
VSLAAGKLLAKLVLPLSAALGLLALALLALALGRRRAAGAALGTALLGLWLASMPAFADRLAAALEGVHPPVPMAEIAPADAILLLGGASKPALPPRDFPELVEASDRVLHAARLFHAGKAPLIVASSGRLPGQGETPPEAEGISVLLQALGVPPSAILREETSTNTYENCVHSKRLLDARGARDVLLVTSALHMRRAFATCATAGLAVRAAPTDFQVAGDEARNGDVVPEPEALLLTHLALRERLGFLVYQRRGWIAPWSNSRSTPPASGSGLPRRQSRRP